MKLSPHFTAAEFACRDDCGLPVVVSSDLLDRLETMRTQVGPIRITSGLRCEAHNRLVGGHPQSEHLTGEGADLVCETAQQRFALVEAAIQAGIHRIGIADRFVHVGVSPRHPRRVLWLYGPSRFAA